MSIDLLGQVIATPSTPTRVLGTAFQPSLTNSVFCSYTVRIVTTATIGGGQDGQVQLKSDATATPTTVRCQARNGQVVTLAIALQSINTQDSVVSYICPAGHYVNLVSTNNTGTPTISIVAQTEVTLG